MSLIANLMNSTKTLGRFPAIVTKGLIRAMSSRRHCDVIEDEPPCGKSEKECLKPITIMTYNPECCLDECIDAPPRYDDLYYRESNKDRQYTRTWVECPRFQIRPRKVCRLERIKGIPFVKRVKPFIPPVACPYVPTTVEEEKKEEKTKCHRNCAKISWPGCRIGREPPRCAFLGNRGPKNCRKMCTPYPSYSECTRPKRKPMKKIECDCLKIGALCMYNRK